MIKKNILCCLDGQRLDEALLDYGSWVSRGSGLPLKLLYALETIHPEEGQDLSGIIGLGAQENLLDEFVKIEHEKNKLMRDRGAHALAQGEERAKANAVALVEKCLRKGTLEENVLDLKAEASLALLGRSENSLETTIRSFEGPAMVVSAAYRTPESLCLAFDGSQGAKAALEFLLRSPFLYSLQVHMIYVGETTENINQEMATALQRLGSVFSTPKMANLQGEVIEALSLYVRDNDIDLLCSGAFGHSWLREVVLGSLTEKLMSAFEIPVLLVR